MVKCCSIFVKTVLFLSLLFFNMKEMEAQELIPVELTTGKTTHLFFSANIKYCDVGNGDIEYKENGSILSLSTKKVNFEETNLTVVTTDNRCYNFLLMYSIIPRTLMITPDSKMARLVKADSAVVNNTINNIPDKQKTNPAIATTSTVKSVEIAVTPIKVKLVFKINHDSIILLNCKKLIHEKPKYADISHIKQHMAFMLSNVVMDDSCLYISMEVQNNSYFDYQVSFINFQSVEKKKLFTALNREDVKKPIFIFNKREVFNPKQTEKMVYVFNRFKIAKGRKMIIEVAERNDQRFLMVIVPASVINEAGNL